MKHQYTKILAVIFSASLLAACVTTPRSTMIGALSQKYPNVIVIEVPDTNNPISSTLALAAIKSGVDSNTSKSIVDVLSKKPSNPVVVMGKNDSLSAATLERALVSGKDKVSGSKVIFVGSADYTDSLTKAANASGVQLEVLVPH